MIGPSLYGLSGSCIEVAHTSRSTRWLANVRVWPLLWVAARWKRRIPPDVNAQSVWLTFPVVFEQAIETGDDLCRRTGGAELTPLERFFVRRAFKLTTTAPDRAHLDLASVMEELGDAALSSINDGRVNSFSRALSNLLEFHRIAIQLGSYSVDINFGNYLEMANNPVGSMQTLHGRLLDPYRKLAQYVIDVADMDIGPLQSAAHSTDALLSHVREKASLEVREQLLFIAGFQWGAFRARRHRTIGSGSWPANSDDLPARKSETEIVDAKIARTLCSAWDSIAFQLLRQDDLRRDWMDLAHRGKECVHFLEKTTSHILVAVADNDALVGRWALDLIQRWTGNWFQIIEEHASWEEFPQISEGVLELSWESTEQALGISGEGLRSEAAKQRDVFAEILLNAWRDSCGFLATWLLAQTKDGDPRQDLCRSLLKALLSGEVLEGAGSTHSIRQPFDHFDATLASWLRANILESANPNLAGNLWGRLDRWANDSTRQPWVSGRAYGSDDQVETINLADAALLRLLLGPNVQFGVSQALSDATLVYSEQGANYAERTKQRLINVQDQLLTIDLAPWLPAFELLQPGIGITDIDSRRTQLADELGVLHDRLAARHDEQLNQRALDAVRLQQILGACNRIAFSRDDGALPLPYFDTVETVEGMVEQFTLTLPKRNKAELVTPPLATSPSNELSWYEKTTRDCVALDIRNKILAQIQPKEVTVKSAKEFADELDEAAAELHDAGFEALLFIASRRDVDYRWRSELVGEDLNQARPIHIEKHEGYAHPGYLLHANGIPAIRMTIRHDSAFLIPRECFDTVRFTRSPDGAAARLVVNEEPDQQVSLALVWGALVTLRNLPTYRFILAT